ncbi:MAG: hypothetical protein QXW83_00535, partial [Nitrososphaerales archaeon]
IGNGGLGGAFGTSGISAIFSNSAFGIHAILNCFTLLPFLLLPSPIYWIYTAYPTVAPEDVNISVICTLRGRVYTVPVGVLMSYRY